MDDILRNAHEYEARYRVVARAHYLAAGQQSALNKLFGIPVIVITAIVGTTIFGTLNQNPNPMWKILAGLLTLSGTVLAALQTNLGFAQTAEKHKAAGEAYRGICRAFGMFELKFASTGPDQRAVALSELDQLIAQLDKIPKGFPSVPDCFYEKAKREDESRRTQERGRSLGPGP